MILVEDSVSLYLFFLEHNTELFLVVVLIASAKSQSTRGTSHQPAFMSSCLTASRICPVYLVKEHWCSICCWEGGEPKRWRAVSWEVGKKELILEKNWTRKWKLKIEQNLSYWAPIFSHQTLITNMKNSLYLGWETYMAYQYNFLVQILLRLLMRQSSSCSHKRCRKYSKFVRFLKLTKRIIL